MVDDVVAVAGEVVGEGGGSPDKACHVDDDSACLRGPAGGFHGKTVTTQFAGRQRGGKGEVEGSFAKASPYSSGLFLEGSETCRVELVEATTSTAHPTAGIP